MKPNLSSSRISKHRPFALLIPALAGLIAVSGAVAASNISSQSGQSDADAPKSPIEGLSALIGVWDFSDELIKKNPDMGNLHHFIFEWGPQKNSIKIRELVNKKNRDAALLQGFIMRHPSEGRIVFHGASAAQNFLFEGEYRITGETTFQRLYTVHYPADYDFQYLDPSLPGVARQFREELELKDDNTLFMQTYMWSDGEWTKFPAGFPPLIMTRAE